MNREEQSGRVPARDKQAEEEPRRRHGADRGVLRILFRPEAEDELIEAIDCYELRSPGLGGELLRCVDACVARIIRQPESYLVVHRETRMALVHRFP